MNSKNIQTILTKLPISGLLLGLAWPPTHNYLLLFIAFIPLIYIIERQQLSTREVFTISFTNFLLFLLITIYWIYNAGQEFGILVSLALLITLSTCVAILMSLAITICYYINKTFKLKIFKYISLIVTWLSYEYLSFNWDLHFPWLTLGNGLAVKHEIIQWYEATGAFGGSLWILLVNIVIYELLISTGSKFKYLLTKTLIAIAIVLLPTYISVHLYNKYKYNHIDTIDVAVIQPNLDPYSKKFNHSLKNENLNQTVKLTKDIIDDNTKLIIWPETVFFDPIQEGSIPHNRTIDSLKKELLKSSDLSLLTGITTIKHNDSGYDVYNAAALLTGNTSQVQIYHKNKLVPFVETMPYPAIMKKVSEILPTWGISSFYKASNQNVIFNLNDKVKIATAICYDSIFGNLVGSSVNKGANIIAIITNDGWWKDTNGYKQHALYAKLLAISNRRSVARSANTGISEFINERGDILQATKWNQAIAIKAKLSLNNNKTFYSKHNDYIAIISIYIFVLLAIISTICKIYNSNKQHKAS